MRLRVAIAIPASLLFATFVFAAAPKAPDPGTPAIPAVEATSAAVGVAEIDASVGVVPEVNACEARSALSEAGWWDIDSVAAQGQGSCGHGIRACSANQVGQPCDPNNLNILCSQQSNGRYCCLAYAP